MYLRETVFIHPLAKRKFTYPSVADKPRRTFVVTWYPALLPMEILNNYVVLSNSGGYMESTWQEVLVNRP